LFAYGIFKVIYAPFKTFKEIIHNPKYIGPVLIMILFIATNTGFAYILASKMYNEQTLPIGATQKDEWTESSIWWVSNTVPSESNDSLSGGFYGDKSIEFSIDNDKQIWMQLNFNESIVCSGARGFKNVSFRIKIIYPNTTELLNATLYLFSNETDYFQHDLATASLPSSDVVWNNLNISLGHENDSEWIRNGDAEWSNITSLKFEFMWSENANLTVRVDGLFFRGVFKSIIDTVGASNYLLGVSLSAFMQFTITWVFLGGLIFLISKALGAKLVWKAALIVIGFALITMFIQATINTVTAVTLPTLYRPLEFFGGAGEEGEIARNIIFEKIMLTSQVNEIVQIALLVWTVVLCVIAVRSLTEFSWDKSILIAVVAYFVSMIAASFIISY